MIFRPRSILLCLLGLLPACVLVKAEPECAPVVSLEESWRWKELESLRNYGISQAVVGPEGDLWFAHAEGLLRYDGIILENHPIEFGYRERIHGMLFASDGRIFVANGPNIFIWKDRQVSRVPIADAGPLYSTDIMEDRERRILLSGPSGFFQILGQDLKRIAVSVKAPGSTLVDAEGNIWIADRNTHEVHVFRLIDVGESLVVDPVFSTAFSKRNPFPPKLFLTSGGKVLVIYPDAEDWCYLFDDFEKKPALHGLREAGLFDPLLEMTELRPGEFWFCMNRRLGKSMETNFEVYGIEHHPIPSSYPYIISLPGLRLLLGGQNLTPVVVDLSLDRWAVYPGLSFEVEDPSGTCWFLSQDRQVVAESDSEWKSFNTADGVIDTPNRIIAGSDGSIWASGSHEGRAAVAYFMAEKWTFFSFPAIAITFSHLAATETQEGVFIFGAGTPENELGGRTGGAVAFQKRGDSYFPVRLPPPIFNQRPANIVERPEDGLYFGSGSLFRGLSSDGSSSANINLFQNNWIDHMLVDCRNHLWLAVLGVGIYQFDGRDWILHDESNGLVTKKVISLLESPERSGIITLTGEGFFRFDGTKWSPWGFPIDQPLQRENHTLASDHSGNVWINFASRSWYLEGGQMDKKDSEFLAVRYTPDSSFPETFAQISKVNFPEGGYVKIQISGRDYWDDTLPAELMYSWSLNGTDWSSFSKTTEIFLSELPAGDHGIRVRARDKDGKIDQTPAVASFTIVAPLWKQPWFIFVAALILIVLALLLYYLERVHVKSALALEEFKLDFFTNLSHELRNPLSVIMTPIERLLERESDADRRYSLELVLKNARQMQGMVDQLLQFRKLQKQRWDIRPAGGEIVSYIRESVMNLKPLWEKKEQRLQLTTSPTAFLCNFDYAILQKITDNLVANAIKYSEVGTNIAVQVEIENAQHQKFLLFAVEDEGVGIPLHEQQHVLRPFYRVRGNDGGGGCGIGLALAHQLTQLWGGAITIESPVSETGKGTRVQVRLPLDPFEPQEPGEALVGEYSDGDGRSTLLIVEDNEDFRHVLKKELEHNYVILESSNGLEGLETAKSRNPDLVISDVLMPGMSGFDLCRALKADSETSHIPIILLTAKSSAKHRVEGIKLGADAYLPKPLDFNYLLARIRNLLDSRKELRRKFASQIVVEPNDLVVTPTDELILRKALEIVENNMREEDFDVVRFGELMGMSQSSLKRKLKAITGLTPKPFIQKMRLKRAAQLLSQKGMRVSDVAELVGIYDLSYFGKIFRKEFGKTPSQFKESEGDVAFVSRN